MRSKTLYLPVETAARELDAKLLLALYAVGEGFRVILASRALLNLRIHQYPPGLYLSHNFDARRGRILNIVRRLGHQLVAWDEEGLVWLNSEAYKNRRVSPEAISNLECIYAWGDEQAALLKDVGTQSGTDIEVLGNPRADLLSPSLRPLFAGRAAKLVEKHGDFILINSNFGWLNYALASVSDAGNTEQHLQKIAERSRHPIGYLRHRNAVFLAFRELLCVLSQTFPNRKIIVRPHPSESPDAWREATSNLAGVSVIYDKDLVPWLMAAGSVIHNGCTTAVETAQLGKAPISFEPVFDAPFESAQPHAVSLIAKTPEEVCALIKEPQSPSGAQLASMNSMIAGMGGSPAAERIAQDLSRRYHPEVSSTSQVSGRLLAKARGMEKQLMRHSKTSASHMEYVSRKFPPTDVKEIIANARAMCDLTSQDMPRITEQSDRIFLLESSI